HAADGGECESVRGPLPTVVAEPLAAVGTRHDLPDPVAELRRRALGHAGGRVEDVAVGVDDGGVLHAAAASRGVRRDARGGRGAVPYRARSDCSSLIARASRVRMTVASERAIRRLCWAAVVAWRTRLNDLRAARSILDSRLRSPAPAASVVSWTREVKFAIAVSIRRRTPAPTSLAGAVPSAPSMPSSQQV